MVLEYLAQAQQAEEAAAVESLAEMDRVYLLGNLRNAHSVYFEQGQVPGSFVFCLFDLVRECGRACIYTNMRCHTRET